MDDNQNQGGGTPVVDPNAPVAPISDQPVTPPMDQPTPPTEPAPVPPVTPTSEPGVGGGDQGGQNPTGTGTPGM